MVLVLKNKEMAELLPYRELLRRLTESMETAFLEYGNQVAVNRPRSRMYIPTQEPNTYYWFNNIAGIVPSFRAMALRIDSSLAREVQRGGKRREEYPGDYVGLVFLFDTETCQLLSIMDDHFHSPIRVAATSALGSRFAARPGAKVMALFGAGEQARAQAVAFSLMHRLEQIKVYSPDAKRRKKFASSVEAEAECQVTPVDSAREAIQGADIVNTATNSSDPVFDGRWLEPGMHVTTIVGGDYRSKRDEIDSETYLRTQTIIVNTRNQVEQDHQGNLYELLQDGRLRWDQLHELGEVVTGKVRARNSAEDITLFKNNHGMGIQFAASARLLYEQARKEGVGTELPDELFHTKREGVWSP
ncbi:MAG: ornithine cyclodeaminase family protein [Acidobacteria bacterium]|nr:ornithine cyclodeaminase family protein [Acidobacteriota bacterium]